MKALDGLTQHELATLRGALQTRGKEARKAAIKAISGQETLKAAWAKYMGPKPLDAPDDYSLKAREAFEAELARCPDAFVKQMVANLHIEMDQAIKDKMLELSKIRK